MRYGANVNLANSSGETPLISAVQMSKPELVRVLLEGGAERGEHADVSLLDAEEAPRERVDAEGGDSDEHSEKQHDFSS